MPDPATPLPGAKAKWLRWTPLLVLLLGLALFFALGGHRYASFEQIKTHRELLKDWVARWGALALLAYMLGYAAMTAFSIPGGALATLVAGFLFGAVGGTAIGVFGGTVGAVALFLAARTALGDMLRARAGPALRRMEEGFRQNAFSYLLGLRLIPAFPFWLVNLVPAFCGVNLRTYVLATFFGIVPGTFIYAWVGAGLDEFLKQGGDMPNLGVIFQPQFLLPILGLALLALLPPAWKWFKNRRPHQR